MTGHNIPKGHFYLSKAHATQLQIPVSDLDRFSLFPSNAGILKADLQFPRV